VFEMVSAPLGDAAVRDAPAAPTSAPAAAPDFGRVFREYAPYVAAIAMRLLGRDDEVDDLVQEVFLEALRGLGRLREKDALKGWLATVTVRTARRRLRLRRIRGMFHVGDAPAFYDAVADDAASPEQRTLLRELYRALDRVPVDERIAWTLRHVHGEELEAVATLCGCSLATVKRGVAAAHECLGKVMRHG
jgi:RNA polymerase sigma-70 factor (ECF subfamily)